MKINGWKRIGIVLSVAWILGAGWFTFKTESDRDIRRSANIWSACEQTAWDAYSYNVSLPGGDSEKREAVAKDSEAANLQMCSVDANNRIARDLPIEREDAVIADKKKTACMRGPNFQLRPLVKSI